MRNSVTDYATGIQDAYFGELAAERVYRALARRASDPLQQEKFNAIADIEQRTAGALAPVARRLGIEVTEADLDARARVRLTTLDVLSWEAFVAQAAATWPPYIALFEGVASQAPRSDADAMQLLVAHERALVRFIELERQHFQGRESLEPLRALLALMPRAGLPR